MKRAKPDRKTSPRFLSWVKSKPTRKKRAPEDELPFPKRNGPHYLYLGEIPNQPGHAVLLGFPKRRDPPTPVVAIWHTDELMEVPESDV